MRVPTEPNNSKLKEKGDLFAAQCPSRGVLDHITSRWGSLILVVLLEKTHRFNELARRVGGVSEKMLAQSLQALQADGFVLRTVYPTVPPKVEYSLTAMGKEAAARVQVLTSWVESNVAHVVAFRNNGNKSANSTS